MLTSVIRTLAETSPGLELLLKVTVLLLLGWSIHFSLRRFNPRWRVLLWRTVIFGVFMIPFVAFLTPGVRIHFTLPAESGLSGGNHRPNHDPLNHSTEIAAVAKSPGAVIEESPGLNSASGKPLSRAEVSLVAVLLWAIVFCVLATQSIRSRYRVRQLVKASVAPPEDVSRLFVQVASALGCTQKAALRLSSQVASPFLAGVEGSVILCPKRLVDKEHREDLAAIFSHEIAHLNSRDLLWFGAGQWLSYLLWFHPLVWILRKAHNDACERVSDTVAAAYVGDAARYSGSLARIALQLIPGVSLAGGLAMVQTPQIMERLGFLKREDFFSSLGRRWVALSLSSGCVLLIAFASLKLICVQESQGNSVHGYLAKETSIIAVAERPRTGEEAPPFSVTALDGKEIKLQDYRGKMVLLSFSAAGCSPYIKSIPDLKDFYREIGQYTDFEMIGLGFDDTESELRRFVGSHEITWPQAHLGKHSDIAANYGVGSVPVYYLIDPDGKIVNIESNWYRIKEKVFTDNEFLSVQVFRPLSRQLTGDKSTHMENAQVMTAKGALNNRLVVSRSGE